MVKTEPPEPLDEETSVQLSVQLAGGLYVVLRGAYVQLRLQYSAAEISKATTPRVYVAIRDARD